jgi:glycosyltransferase involved in cell wall biosynthesis
VLANEPHSTAYCDVAEWNTTAKKNIEKTGFVPVTKRRRKKKRSFSPMLRRPPSDYRALRVCYIAIDSPYRCSSWSGIPFHTLKELHSRFDDLHVIDTPIMDRLLRRTSAVTKYGMLPNRSRLVTSIFQILINRSIARIAPDVVISVGAAHKISEITSDVPLVHVTDALYPTIIQYYDKYKRLSKSSVRLGLRLQEAVVKKTSAIVLASEWAANSASEFYPEARQRISIVPLGANLHPKSWVGPSNDLSGPIRLLFVGYDWERKGGGIVLETFNLLQTRWPDAELHIVGCTPEKAAALQGVFLHGLLKTDHEHERRVLEQLFQRSSFFFMPSKQEAYGIAYCEACSFGLPPVASETGGVPTIIKDGVNGILLNNSNSPADYASRIEECWSRAEMYRAMQLAARRAFELRLNWNAWGEDIEATLMRVVGADTFKPEGLTSARDS